MWMPTHVQVTVQKATKLLTKGKNNKNDCFVTIALGKTKYQTSIKEKAGPDVEWHEECELPIPDQGNTAEIILTALHHNNFGVDEFLGRVAIPLNSLDIYERPKNKWYTLESKPGKSNKPAKERGSLEVKIGFTVRSGSLTDLHKKEKHKTSLSHVAQSVGGSLLSLGSVEKRKGIKKFAKSIGSKMHLKGKKKDGDLDDSSSIGSIGSLQRRNIINNKFKSKQTKDDADPGVVSDEDEFTFDDLSHKSSVSSLSQPSHNLSTSINSVDKVIEINKSPTTPPKPPRLEDKTQDEWESKLYGKNTKNLLKPSSNENLHRRSWDMTRLSSQIEEESNEELKQETVSLKSDVSPMPNKKEEQREGMFSKLKNLRKDKHDLDLKRDKLSNNSSERIIIGGENKIINYNNHIPNELLQKFEGKSREDLILMICNLQNDLDSNKKKLKDLEDYLDELLLRVMETTPRILQNPYVTCKYSHRN